MKRQAISTTHLARSCGVSQGTGKSADMGITCFDGQHIFTALGIAMAKHSLIIDRKTTIYMEDLLCLF